MINRSVREWLRRLSANARLQTGQQAIFVASATATTVAALLTLAAPIVAIAFDLIALLLVVADLRRRYRASQARHALDQAIDNSMEAVIWEEIPGRAGALRVTASAEHFMGYSVDQWRVPYFWQSIIHHADLDRVVREVEEAAVREISYQVVFRAYDVDGDVRWLENRVTSVRSNDNVHMLFAGVMLDRTAQVEAINEADILRQVVQESPLPYLIVTRVEDGRFDVASMNLACAALFRVGRKAAIGMTLRELVAARTGMERLLSIMHSSTPVSERFQRAELRLPADAGTDESAQVLEVVAQNVGTQLVALSFVEITERVLANERLTKLALHDSLTQLPNRRLLAERLTTELAWSAESGSPTALVTLDLNEFKEVNDALGHDTGDQLLVAIGERLAKAAPSGATVARLGGDEFAVLLPATTLEEGEAQARKLADVARERIDIDGLALSIRASMGVVAAPNHGYDAADLLRLADVAMYASKRTGDDVTCYHADVDPFSKRRVRMLGELESAMAASQFEVYYQPIVDLATNRTVSTEGLVRWRHPDLGLISPLEFIELAEVTGTIGRLTRIVIGRVLQDAIVMDRAGFAIQVSCNLSTRNLFEQDFVESVGELITMYGLPAGGLRLEITEGDVMEDPVKAKAVMRGLAALGITLAIDDFGTGHSSLERLRDLPVNCVKIDQSFVHSLMDGPRSHTLLRDIITMLENLGFTTVAEGIEDVATLDQLTEFGCTYGQGFLWSRPLPMAEFLGYLTSERTDAEAAHDLVTEVAGRLTPLEAPHLATP